MINYIEILERWLEGNIEVGKTYTIVDKLSGEISTVKIQKCNPIRNWFKINGDTKYTRRWILDFEWMEINLN